MPSELSFEESDYIKSKVRNAQVPSRLSRLVIKLSGGLVQTEKQAQLVMIAFIIVASGIIFVLNFAVDEGRSATISAPEGGIVEYPEGQPPRLRQ